MQCCLIVLVQLIQWAEYYTPEKFMGTDFTDKVYSHEPEESYQLVFEHLKTILPEADEEQIKRILK